MLRGNAVRGKRLEEFLYLYASVSVCLCDGAAMSWSAVAHEVQKKTTEPLELKSQGILSH